MISFRFGKTVEKLQKDFSKWLKSNPPPQINEHIELGRFVEISSAWQKKLASARWVAVHWPQEFGGRGLSLVEEAVVQEMLADAGAPQLINLFGITMVGPVLIEHGTEQQKRRFLSRILTADDIWCQGFSEPEAGSDLASLRTRADKVIKKDDAVWRLSGQKVWTSFAQYADYCFMLARTDSSVKKHKGLSYFLVSMKTPGITVRPLTQISGDREFNEVFFDEVDVPEGLIVGHLGDGWKIAISTLMYERVVLTFARHLQSNSALSSIAEILNSRKAEEEEKTQLGRLTAKSMALRALAISHLMTYDRGVSPGPEGSVDKLMWSETFQEICQFAIELLGTKGVITSGQESVGNGVHQHRYLYSRGRTIAAGTSEIQRNIIAERLLELPRG